MQQKSSITVSLKQVRVLFDGLIKEQPGVADYLKKDASIGHDVAFESAIVKMQKGEESKLNIEEKAAVAHCCCPLYPKMMLKIMVTVH